MRGPTLQAILGHSNFNTTKRFYLGIAPGDLEAEHRSASPLDKLSKNEGMAALTTCARKHSGSGNQQALGSYPARRDYCRRFAIAVVGQ